VDEPKITKLKIKLMIPVTFLLGMWLAKDLKFLIKPTKNPIIVGMPQTNKKMGRKHETRFITAGPGTRAQSGKYSQIPITQMEITIPPIRMLPNINAALGELLTNVRIRDVMGSNLIDLSLNEAADGVRNWRQCQGVLPGCTSA
jgi:hypothetical protein